MEGSASSSTSAKRMGHLVKGKKMNTLHRRQLAEVLSYRAYTQEMTHTLRRPCAARTRAEHG